MRSETARQPQCRELRGAKLTLTFVLADQPGATFLKLCAVALAVLIKDLTDVLEMTNCLRYASISALQMTQKRDERFFVSRLWREGRMKRIANKTSSCSITFLTGQALCSGDPHGNTPFISIVRYLNLLM